MPKAWATRMYKSGIITLLDVPHFGPSPSLYSCVIFLLSKLHGGNFWLDHTYPVNPEVMHMVSGLLRTGEDAGEAISARGVAADEIYQKYGTHQGMHGVVISAIQDP